jgi:predicted unusual protein kinase regulating ubiquinone biosynthesis (AarF/ABC1/UbiB family)
VENGDKQNKIPSGKIVRSGIIGVTTARAGIKKLGHISKKPFLSEENELISRKKNDDDIARMIFKALSMLKGAPLKLAQMMSMEMEFLPESYHRELAKCTSQVPPMNRALIRKVIITELGNPPEKLFREFEPVPFAAASLGQVHRALSHDGVEIAVKVQYPGIAQSVKSDMEMLKGIIKVTPYAGMMNGVAKEIQTRITEELDYENEAANTIWFREHSDNKSVVIPEVISKLSSKRVLTTTRIKGLHLNEWLATNPSQDKRDRSGQRLCDLFMENTWKHRVIHADPNPGNFIFMDDGRMGVIDFGCIKSLDDTFLESIRILDSAGERNDFRKIKQMYNAIGIQYKDNSNDKEFENFIVEWIDWITKPIRSECFDFGANQDYFSEGMKLAPQMYKYVDKFDGSFLYFGRAEYGLYRILHRLGAKVKMNMFEHTGI